MRRLMVLALALAVLSAANIEPASAGSYDVYACGGPAGAAQNAFQPYANLMMSAYSICPASGSVGTGIVTKSSSSGGMVPLHAGAFQVFEAPPGAALDSVYFYVGALRFNQYWTVGLVAYDGDLNTVGHQPYGCYAWGPGCGVGTNVFYGPVSAPLYGHSKFRFETRCGNPGGCDVSYSGGIPGNRALFSMANVVVRVVDYTSPSVVPTHGSMITGGWQRGQLDAWSTYSDNVGIMITRLYVDGVLRDEQDYRDAHWWQGARCDFTRRRPCNDIGGGFYLDSLTLDDGVHEVVIEAVDSAGNTSRVTRSVPVDNTAPGKRAIVVSDGEGWHRRNTFDVLVGPLDEGAAPIVRARYRICSAAGTCHEGERSGSDLRRLQDVRAPDVGEYTLRVWLEDAAGNSDFHHASDPVQLRFDDNPPHGAFEGIDPSDPLAINATVADGESGIASAGIELRKLGQGGWIELGTIFDGSRASARIDDLSLPDGVYEARLKATDNAGNEATIDEHGDRSPMRLRLPLRLASSVGAEVEKLAELRRCPKRRVRKRKGPHRRRRCRRPRRYVSTAADGAATVRGRLATRDDSPLANAPIFVYERARGRGSVFRTRSLRTDALGRFTYKSDAGPSRVLDFRYSGTRLVRPSSRRLELAVKARTSFRSSRASVRNRSSVLFRGSLRGGFIPERGKVVVLQAHYRGRWRAFATVRTNSRGGWRYRYRFGATYGTVSYRFRALVRFEAAYPFEQAYSRRLKVKVRG